MILRDARFCFTARAEVVGRFSSSKLDLTFHWRIHCDEMGRVQHRARLVPNVVDSALSRFVANELAFAFLSKMTSFACRQSIATLMKLSTMFGKLTKTVGVGNAIKDILSRF